MTISGAEESLARAAGFAQIPPLVQPKPRLRRQAAQGAQQLGAAVLRLIYPPQCLGCEAVVDQAYGLCPQCWRDTPFITGLVCDSCGLPLPGEEGGAVKIHCDDCLRHPPPWDRGRAALLYDGGARPLILRLKHGDRLDLARSLGDWLCRAAQPLVMPGMIVAPVPLHWGRLASRRANQSALLSTRLARQARLTSVPDLLQRIRATPSQEGRNRLERQENLSGALRVAPRQAHRIPGADILLIDDVMTSGATLSEATRVLRAAGAAGVFVAVLARVPPSFAKHEPRE